MNRSIIVFFSMLITILFVKYLTDNDGKLEEDVVLDFKNEKIKCKCDLKGNSKDVKENFTNYTKNLKIERVPINDNIITSAGNLKKPKHNNITAQTYYQKYFKYPLKPMVDTVSNIAPVNQIKYLNIGNDTNKLIKI